MVLRIVQEKPQMKFERNPCIRFRDNCDTRTTDGRRTKVPYHELCWQSQAELIMAPSLAVSHCSVLVPYTFMMRCSKHLFRFEDVRSAFVGISMPMHVVGEMWPRPTKENCHSLLFPCLYDTQSTAFPSFCKRSAHLPVHQCYSPGSSRPLPSRCSDTTQAPPTVGDDNGKWIGCNGIRLGGVPFCT